MHRLAAVPLLAALAVRAAAPSAPHGLVARPGTGVIGLNWSDVPSATYYRVYAAHTSGGPYTLVAERDRSRHLVTYAPAGSTRWYQVSAVNTNAEESARSSAVSATADADSLDRPALTGNYRIGSSYVTDSYRLQRFLEARGLVVPTYRRQIIGAPIEYIWSWTVENDPAAHAAHVAELQNEAYDALIMNAQRPMVQGNRELKGTVLWSEEALAAVPAYRILIHEYWITEAGSYSWDETQSNRARQQQWYWFASLALAYEATTTLGVPIYVAPIGSAVERAKQAALAGLLDSASSGDDFHPDGSHLNALGKYVQEGVVAAGAYQIDVRGTHNRLDGGTTLSSNDAAILQQIIHDTVRTTPCSGWHTDAPMDLAGYRDALAAALRVHEGFANFPAAGGGTYTNLSGQAWQYSGATPAGTGLDACLRLSAGGTLATVLPRGLLAFSLRMRKPAAGTAELELQVNGSPAGVLATSSADLWGCELINLEYTGAVAVVLENIGTGSIEVDDLIWDETSAGTDAVEIVTRVLEPAYLGQWYQRQLVAWGGSGSYTWRLDDGSLPDGLMLSSAGLISGTPTAPTSATFRVHVADTADAGRSATQQLTLAVARQVEIVVQPLSQTVYLGNPCRLSIAATGEVQSYQWALDDVDLNGATCAHYRIPQTRPLDAGTYRVRVVGPGLILTSSPAVVTVVGGDVLSTTLGGGYTGLSGNTFDLSNTGTNVLVLTGRLTGNFDADPGLVVSAWYRVGTALGHASSSNGWVFWGQSMPFSGLGYGTATRYDLGQPLNLPTGTTCGVYVLLTAGSGNLAYSAGPASVQQGPMRLTGQQGLGGGAPFTTSTFGPTRVYNGSIEFYELLLQDADGDGLPDGWEHLYSGSITGMSATADLDGDTHDNRAERIAGTDPTNKLSVLHIAAIQPLGRAQGVVLTWPSVADRVYDLWWAPHAPTAAFTAIATSVPATPPLNTHTDTAHTAVTAGHYRIEVQLEEQ
jgi:hypothetical protein